MPRPIKPTENPGVHGQVDKKAANGHTITVYADRAVYDETAGKFIDYLDLVRKN